jgi:hypothetical protein
LDVLGNAFVGELEGKAKRKAKRKTGEKHN